MHLVEKEEKRYVCCALLNTIRHLTNRHAVNSELKRGCENTGVGWILKIKIPHSHCIQNSFSFS